MLADRSSDWDSAERHALQAIDRAERCGAAETAALAQATVAWVQLTRDTPHRALPHIDAAVAWAGRIPDGYEQALAIARTVGARHHEGALLQRIGGLHRERGDAHTALQWHAQALAVHDSLGNVPAACRAAAAIALCQFMLGQRAAALAAVDRLLARLGSELAAHPAHDTIEVRWTCHQVLSGAADARAAALLAQLAADVLERVAFMTEESDRARLIEAHAVYRAVVAAHARRAGPASRAA